MLKVYFCFILICNVSYIFHKKVLHFVLQIKLLSKYNQRAITYCFCDINFHKCGCTERRRASVSGLDHHRPGAVFLICDVLNYVHWLDVGLQFDFSCICIDVKDIVRFCFHDGILNNIVWLLCIIVYCLNNTRNSLASIFTTILKIFK